MHWRPQAAALLLKLRNLRETLHTWWSALKGNAPLCESEWLPGARTVGWCFFFFFSAPWAFRVKPWGALALKDIKRVRDSRAVPGRAANETNSTSTKGGRGDTLLQMSRFWQTFSWLEAAFFFYFLLRSEPRGLYGGAASLRVSSHQRAALAQNAKTVGRRLLWHQRFFKRLYVDVTRKLLKKWHRWCRLCVDSKSGKYGNNNNSQTGLNNKNAKNSRITSTCSSSFTLNQLEKGTKSHNPMILY